MSASLAAAQSAGLRASRLPAPLVLPAEPDPKLLPRYADRRQLAQIHRQYWGPQSARTLERWPLEWRIVGGRAVTSVRDFIAEAQRRFDEAPVIRGGRRSPQENA